MADNKKEDCKYWDKCYRKNPSHLAKYNHPLPVVEKQTTEDETHSTEEERPKHKLDSPSSDAERESQYKRRRNSTPSPQDYSEESTSPKKDQSNPSIELQDSNAPPIKETDILMEKEEELLNKDTPANDSKSANEKNVDGSSSSSSVAPSEKSTGHYQEQLREAAERKEMDITKEYNKVIKNLSQSNYFEIFQRRVRYSKQAEYQDLLKTPEFIRHKFFAEMPEEFYKFWEFTQATEISEKENVEKFLHSKLKVKLVGPFDYLAGKFHDAKIQEPGDYLRHWRFYYDPPEFQTIFVLENTGIHFGYWRDNPKDKENLLVARNDADRGCKFEFVGGNCFEALLSIISKDVKVSPFNRSHVEKIRKVVTNFAKENNINLSEGKLLEKKRSSSVVTKTFHQLGIVVPFDRKTEVGYRCLPESDLELKNILSLLDQAENDKKILSTVMGKLQPLITAANIASDESDFGTALELGIDLFCSGHRELHSIISSLLISVYSLLDRPQFIAIMKAHLQDRKKTNKLSILNE